MQNCMQLDWPKPNAYLTSCEAQITNFHAIELHCNALHSTHYPKRQSKRVLASFGLLPKLCCPHFEHSAEYHLGLSFSTHENSLSAVVTNKTLELKHGAVFVNA